MREVGIDYFTGGNHIWAKKEFWPYLDDENVRVIRPGNVQALPGRGVATWEFQGKMIQLVNLMGRAFMHQEAGDYFAFMDDVLEKTHADIRILDFHAEATSEKAILGYYLDGKITAFLGTHTHVPTADERILPQGTAFQTDLGMTGPLNSSLGAKLEPYLESARNQTFAKYEVATGPVVFNATLLEIGDDNKATKIERIQKMYNN
jgi:metallophosphoesterase (TIGR00282 family)